MEYAKGADVIVHESIYTPEGMNKFYGWNNMRTAVWVSSYIHTPPAACGKDSNPHRSLRSRNPLELGVQFVSLNSSLTAPSVVARYRVLLSRSCRLSE